MVIVLSFEVVCYTATANQKNSVCVSGKNNLINPSSRGNIPMRHNQMATEDH